MPIAQPTGPVPSASAGQTTRATRSSSATSIPANKAPVELTLIARQMVSAPSAGAEPTTLGTPSQDVALSLALQVLVERTLTAHHLDRRLFANARQIMSAIRTQTVGSIPARALGQIWTFFCQLCYLFMLSWTHGRVFLGQNPAQRLIVIVCVVNLFNTDFKSIQHLHTA